MIDALAAVTLPLPLAKGTFFEYARAMFNSTMVAQWAVLMVSGVLGVCANYVYKWLNDEIGGSLWKYLFTDYPKRTALAFSIYIGWTFTAISFGIVADSMPWGAIINLGASTGFAIDALVNKARRAQWTDEERAAKGTTP